VRTVILGAGAVGGYFGGRLAKAGFPVSFLVRASRYETLSSNGLIVHSVHGDFSLTPALVRKADEAQDPELVIVGLKNYHLEGALPDLEVLVNKGAKVLPLLNGIQHLDRLMEVLGSENVLGGSCYIESTLNAAGEIVHTSPMQDIVFGGLTEEISPEFLDSLEEMLRKSEIPYKRSDSILAEMWNKYIFLASLSGITSSVRQPIGVAINDPVTFSFLGDLVTEVCQVAQSRGITLPENLVDVVLSRMQGISPSMTSSMHRDLEKGQPMELESLHGALLKMAEETGIKTPCIRAVYALLHPYQNGTLIN
jgi:2-dehydropantoate 2-reductase